MSDKQVQRMPIQASSVKKGTFVVLKNRPCKVLEVKTSKTGKHGHAKANITGSCVLTDKKCEEVHPASHNLTEFKLQKLDYLVTAAEKHDQMFKLTALNDDNEEVIFFSNPANPNCKGLEVSEAFAASSDDFTFTVTVIRAPIQTGDNDFKDEELIENFRQDKNQ